MEQSRNRTITAICNVVPDLECLLLGLGVLFVATSWSVVGGYIMGIGQTAGQLPGRAASGYLCSFKVDWRTASAKLRTRDYGCKSAYIKKNP